MAENESLDLGSSTARRWDEVSEDFRNGTPWEKIAPKITRKLHEALRKVFKRLEQKGVSFEQLLNARGSPEALNELVRNTGNQPYAVLFRDVCATAGDNTTEAQGVVNDFLWSVLETITDQIEMRTVAPSRTFVDLQIGKNEVNQLIEADVNRLSQKLAENPAKVPARVGKKGSKSDPTSEMMPMSLLGSQKP